MMNNMQRGQVRELLASQEEEGVEEINKLREVVPPRHVRRIKTILSVTIVHRLTQPVVLS